MPERADIDRRVALAFVVVSVLWGSTYFGIRIALESYPPLCLGGVRFLGAGAVLFAFARWWKREPFPRAREWGVAWLTGSLLFVVGNGLVNVAELSVSSGLASVLVATMPLWAVAFARLFGGAVSKRELAGVLLGLAGVVVLDLGGELRARPGGAACAVLAAMGWALGSVASQRLRLPRGTMRTALQMMCGGATMVALSFAAHEHLPASPSVRATAALVYLFVFGALVGFSAYSYLLAHARPAVATSYAYLNPVVAVALGVFFAGESFGLTSTVGAAIVLGAVFMVRGAPRKASSKAA